MSFIRVLLKKELLVQVDTGLKANLVLNQKSRLRRGCAGRMAYTWVMAQALSARPVPPLP